MAIAPSEGLTRRELLAGGGLVVAFSFARAASTATESQNQGPAVAPKLPGSLEKLPWLDGWIRIDPDGKVTVFSGKVELGQGIKTALLQVAAEELVVNPARITLVTADTDRTANEGYTAGSHSMQDSATAIRNAAAQVRAILVGLAAQKFGAAPDSLKIEDGVIDAGAGRRATYGELVAGQPVLHVQAQPQSPLRDPKVHTVMGQPMHRVDIPAKVTGGIAYVQDLRLPGMVHARVVRPPSPEATLASLDSSAVEKLPGVVKVVRDGSFLAVIAQREWQAVVAWRALAAAARWNEPAKLPQQSRLYQAVLGLQAQDKVLVDQQGSTGTGVKTLSAAYLRPYQLHASIGPSCALAQLVDGKYTVWTHSQGVYPLRGAIAELLHEQPENVRCIHAEGSGCYGHNAADDVAGDAALLARALPGKPVRVQWMREDEHMWEPYGPPMVTGVRASLDAGGSIVNWEYELWSNTHNARPGKAGDLLAGRFLEQPFTPSPPQPGSQPDGLGDRNSIPLYTLPSAKVVYHFLPEMWLRVSALRSLGAYTNVFSIESFMEELARAAGADPVAFRLKHLTDPRARDVVQLAAEKFGWNSYQRRPGRGRGFAFARYKNQAGYAAFACEVEARRDTGQINILRVVAAVDSGEVVNPDGIRNQIEGGIVQSSSWTMSEEVTFDRTRITSRDWAGYPILRFPLVPQRIDVHIVPRPGLPFLGTGEVAQGPTPAMIANALADATGVRVRQLPLSPERVRAALAA
jgi:nicotinate dehydrogenase subunit B